MIEEEITLRDLRSVHQLTQEGHGRQTAAGRGVSKSAAIFGEAWRSDDQARPGNAAKDRKAA